MKITKKQNKPSPFGISREQFIILSSASFMAALLANEKFDGHTFEALSSHVTDAACTLADKLESMSLV